MQEDESNKYFLDGIEVKPIKEVSGSESKALDEDLILFIADSDQKNSFIYYTPSKNEFRYMGEHDINHWSLKTPKGIIWRDHPYLYLTTPETTIQLFDGKKFEYFCATDEIIVTSLKEYEDPVDGYLTPLLYASLEDFQLKDIGTMQVRPRLENLRAYGHYVIYQGVEDNKAGYCVYDTETDESWFTEIENDNSTRLEGVRMTDGALEVLAYNSDMSSRGFYKITKDKKQFYPQNFIQEGFVNPQYTYYIDLAEDYKTFSIKPLCKD